MAGLVFVRTANRLPENLWPVGERYRGLTNIVIFETDRGSIHRTVKPSNRFISFSISAMACRQRAVSRRKALRWFSVWAQLSLAFQSRQPFVRAAVKEGAALLPVLPHGRLQLPPGVFVPFGRDGEFVGNEGTALAAFGAVRRGFPPAVNVRSAQGDAAFEADVIMVGHGVSLCGRRLGLPKRRLPGTAIPCITAAGATLLNSLSINRAACSKSRFLSYRSAARQKQCGFCDRAYQGANPSYPCRLYGIKAT